MTIIKISNQAYILLLEYARRRGLPLAAAIDEIAAPLADSFAVDAAEESVTPAQISLSRRQLAETMFENATYTAPFKIRLLSIDGDENEQYVTLQVEAGEGSAAQTIAVNITYAELDQQPTVYAGGVLIVSRIQDALSVEAGGEAEVKRGRGRPRRNL